MPFNEGDFVLIEYTAKVKDTGQVIETTKEDVAKEHGLYSEDKRFEPLLVIIGEKRVVSGLEEALRDMDVGQEKTFEVPPEKAYGKRDPNKVRRISRREFIKADIDPVPGQVIEFNGVPAIIRDVSGGRVVVDFNHPLAGKTLVYEVKVVSKLESDEDKIRALIKRRFRPKEDDSYKFSIDKERGIVEITIPVDDMLNENIQLAKKALANDIFKYINGINTVVFKEVLEKKTD